MTMKIETFEQLPFGASVSDLDCATVEARQLDELRLAIHRHQLLVIPRQQHLTPKQEVAFYRGLNREAASVWRDQVNNPWEVYKVEQGNKAGTYQVPDEPGVLVLGKGKINHYGLKVTLGGERGAYGKERGSQVLGGGALQWHIDGTFYDQDPCRYTQMRCIEAPSGEGHWVAYNDESGDRLWCEAGSTAFASGRLAFELMPEAQQQACLQSRVHYLSHPFQSSYTLGNSDNGLRAIDEAAEQAWLDGAEPVPKPLEDPLAKIYPLVWTCPVTGRQALMPHPRCLHSLETGSADSRRMFGIVESRNQIEAWMRPAIAAPRVYAHPWKAGDLVIWDNRSTWHSATGKLSGEDRRVMHLTAYDSREPPTCVV